MHTCVAAGFLFLPAACLVFVRGSCAGFPPTRIRVGGKQADGTCIIHFNSIKMYNACAVFSQFSQHRCLPDTAKPNFFLNVIACCVENVCVCECVCVCVSVCLLSESLLANKRGEHSRERDWARQWGSSSRTHTCTRARTHNQDQKKLFPLLSQHHDGNCYSSTMNSSNQRIGQCKVHWQQDGRSTLPPSIHPSIHPSIPSSLPPSLPPFLLLSRSLSLSYIHTKLFEEEKRVRHKLLEHRCKMFEHRDKLVEWRLMDDKRNRFVKFLKDKSTLRVRVVCVWCVCV